MAFDHRTLLFRNLIEHEKHFPKFLDPCWPPPISPPPPHKHRNFSSVSIILICVFSGCFLLISYYVILAKYCSRRNNNSTQNPAQPNPNHNDYLDENQRPAVVDHPIWLINTVGLSNSIINSISACKYKKGDGLIEGTDCSVCLTEFQEDENLRLLPKCNHAFHINCIDTWLRSHKNCPLCRAPIVASVASNSNETEGNSSNLDGQIENLEVEEEGNEEEEEEERELDVQEGRSNEEVAKETLDSRELQIVDGNYSNLEREQVVEEGMQPVRRSVSMDSSAIASIFCFSVGNSSVQEEGKGSSGIEAIGTKKSNLGIIAKNTGSSSGIFRLMGACSSFRGFSSSSSSSSSQEKHASMKRSLSSGGKFLFSRGGRSQSSMLPL